VFGPVRRPALILVALLGLAVAGCGGEDDGDSPEPKARSGSAFERSISAAQDVSASDFPSPGRLTLQDLGNRVSAVQLGLATSVFTEGENRLAFGMIGGDNKFIYGKSAVYVAPTPGDQAEGPFPAPADALVIDPPFRSRNAAVESDTIAAIYAAQLDLRPGRYSVLAVTKTPQGLVGGPASIRVARSTRIPSVGERPPKVNTDTVASAGGDIESIETRVPEDDMHEENFADVIGKKPVVLLFATPALCQTRVCGPVTDIAAQLQDEYGDRATFIHQEVYEDNEVRKGLREPLLRFGLRTEPWLFTFKADGTVAARLEGSFGTEAFRQAVEAALD
jgi:hypothetical protein